MKPLHATVAAFSLGLLVAIGLPVSIGLRAHGYGIAIAECGIVIALVLVALGGWRRFRLVWALSLGALIGYLIPTEKPEHHIYFYEVRDCILNTTHCALIGVIVVGAIDGFLRLRRAAIPRQFSLAALLAFVTAVAGALACFRMYLQILAFER
jgi:hypothetical protein